MPIQGVHIAEGCNNLHARISNILYWFCDHYSKVSLVMNVSISYTIRRHKISHSSLAYFSLLVGLYKHCKIGIFVHAHSHIGRYLLPLKALPILVMKFEFVFWPMVAFKVFKVEMDPWLLKAFPATYKKHIKSLHITSGLWRIQNNFLSVCCTNYFIRS